jgi:uncharacterized tellurite resistance protein B-like protein
MFDALKAFIDDLLDGAERARPFEASDYRLAAAALLIHLASVDGAFDARECARLRDIVETRFGLGPAAARALIAHAAESEREAVDLFRFTSVLNRKLDDEGRRQIVSMLWEMAYADGAVHEFEENVVWRVAELLGVSTRERVSLRQDARDAAGREAAPSPPNPWASR